MPKDIKSSSPLSGIPFGNKGNTAPKPIKGVFSIIISAIAVKLNQQARNR